MIQTTSTLITLIDDTMMHAIDVRKLLAILPMMVLLVSCNSTGSASKMSLGNLLNKGNPTTSSASTIIEQAQNTEASNAAKTGDYTRAAGLYTQLASNFPANGEYLLKTADNLRLSGDTVKARGVYEQVINMTPVNASRQIAAQEGEGICFIQEGAFDQANQILTEILAKDAMRWRTINALGVSYSLTKHMKEALEYYNVALQISDNHPSVLNNMALTYALNGHLKQATGLLEQASKLAVLDSQRKAIALNLALVYGMMGRMQEAENVSKPYLTKAAIYNNLGYYAELANNKALARSYFEKALTASASHYQKAYDNMQKL